MAETREQRQQRFLQRDLDRQAREQQIKEKLPTLGAQAGWMGGLMAPSSGLTDYFGLYPQIPTEENMIPTERLPSFSENIENKRYMDALYQTMGVLGDAAYASTPFTGPAGLIAGTTLKGVGAAGKASKSKGIASLSEQADLVNKYARDEDFVSPTIETLINRAPKDLKGKQITEWVNASANKGVKPKELEYLGIDEFIEANPNASIDEVVRGVSDNQIKIRKNVKSGDDSPVLEFLESTPDTDPLNGSNFWQWRTDDYLYDIEKGDSEIQKQLLDHYNEAWDVNKKSWDDVPETMHEEIADSLATQEYYDNPYEMIEVADAGQNTFALGNEELGYSIFVDGKGIDTGDVPYSNAEARIQLRDAMSREGYDFGRIDGEEDIYSDIQYKSYIDENLPGGENYREVVFNWENAPENVGGMNYSSHFDDENQIAHALVRDRTLEDGSSSLHIDELQSDLHKEGSRQGYRTKEAIELSNKELSKFNSLIDNEYENLQPIIKKYDLNLTEVDWNLLPGDIKASAKGKRAKDYVNEAVRKYTKLEMVGPSELPKDLNDALMKLEDAANSSIDESGKLFKMVPDYPFKDDWYNMGIKSLLVDAIDEGKDAISISTSAAMKNRYSDRYHKFYEMLYDKKIPSAMQKLAKKYGGKFEKGSLDLDDTYGAGFKETARNPNVMKPELSIEIAKANTIKITPEMREKVLKEGIPTFSAGGVIGNFPSRLSKI
jgi:hypothetical protein